MRTPSARSATIADDYFSLSAGGIPPSGLGGGIESGDGRETDDRMSVHLSTLEPVWKNRAWRDGLQVVEGAEGQEGKSTRRSSMAQSDSGRNSGITSPRDGTQISAAAAAASAAARKLSATFAKMAEGSGGMDDRDIAMKERLGTVHEGREEEDGEDDDDEYDDSRFAREVNHGNDDYEPENGVETWRASWNFLSTSEQNTLFNWILDFIEQSEVAHQPDRRTSFTDSNVEESPHSSICSLLPEEDETVPNPVTNSTLRLPGLLFTAVLTSADSSPFSPRQFLVLSTSPLVDKTRRLSELSEQFRSQRHHSTSSSLSAITPGPSLLQRQQQQLQNHDVISYRSPAAIELQGLTEEETDVLMEEDPWTLTLGNTEMARRIREFRWDQSEYTLLKEPLFNLSVSHDVSLSIQVNLDRSATGQSAFERPFPQFSLVLSENASFGDRTKSSFTTIDTSKPLRRNTPNFSALPLDNVGPNFGTSSNLSPTEHSAENAFRLTITSSSWSATASSKKRITLSPTHLFETERTESFEESSI
jgi:hypothetical protein